MFPGYVARYVTKLTWIELKLTRTDLSNGAIRMVACTVCYYITKSVMSGFLSTGGPTFK